MSQFDGYNVMAARPKVWVTIRDLSRFWVKGKGK